MTRYLADESATAALAQSLFDALPGSVAGWTILLSGELGAGKSTFARALIRAAGQVGAIPSPTYTLVEPYDLARGRIYHVDLYRISGQDELRYLGWNELDDGLRIVEWPERAPGLAADADLSLQLDYDGNGRTAELLGLSSRGSKLLESLSDADSKD